MNKLSALKILVFLLICKTLFAGGNNYLIWNELDTLPPSRNQEESLGVAGDFAGISDGALIIAGGANFSKPYWQSSKQWHDDIWVLENYSSDMAKWKTGFSLDYPIGYGMSVTTPKGLVCLGGNDAQQVYDDVIVLAWDATEQKIIKTQLPDIPLTCTLGSAAFCDNRIYVAGGQSGMDIKTAMKNFWVLDLEESEAGWKQLNTWPGSGRVTCTLTAQHNGEEYCLYLMGGKYFNSQTNKAVFLNDVYEYSPTKDKWTKKTDMPLVLGAASACALGQSQIYVFGGDDGSYTDMVDELKDEHPGFNNTIFAYNVITDAWATAGTIQQPRVTSKAIAVDDGVILSPGEIRPRVRTPQISKGTFSKNKYSFGWINYTALFLYLASMLAIGGYFVNRNKNTDDYFRGGQKIPPIVAGLSMFATGVSSITFIAVPAICFATDWTFIMVSLMVIVVVPFAMFFVLPHFRKIDATSAYEYLEQRFNLFIRLFAAVSFILFQIGRMAIVMFLPALALSTITSISVAQCILIMGVLSVIYCTLGGFEAVVWTDAVQSFVLLGGALLSFLIIINRLDGGFSQFISVAQADNKFHMVNWDFSKTSIFTSSLWVFIIGGIGQNLVPYVSDQAIVQRYMAVSDIKAARKATLTSMYIGIAASFLFFSIGTALYVFYKNFPQNINPSLQNDAVFPLFIANQLPIGIAGIVVAGIFAAAQSSISTSMNSISAVIVTDFARRFSFLKTEKGYLNLARLCTFLAGCLGTAMAVFFASADIKSLWESFMSLLGLFGGSMCGLFMLGMFTKRVGGNAATIGAIISVVILFFIKNYTPISFLLYATIGIISCFAVGFIFSFIIPEKHSKVKVDASVISSKRP